MTPWQLLRASRANQAALGYRLHHGPGRPLHYSAAVVVTAAAAAPDSSRSFCLSREKDTLQRLNSRLASYLRQVQCLEAANHKLQCQIQRELDRKCPRELKELDGHLRTVSLLQDQISECHSARAQVKLQLLNAELDVYDLSVRCENECERRGGLEVELNNLRLQEQELVRRLPELQSLLSNQTQQLKELQIQHQQDMQGFLAQMSGGISVEMQPTESFDLIQQLDNLRQMSEMTVDKNQNERWFNTQVSTLSSPAVTCEPGSEVIQAELGVLRRRAAGLEEELTRLQALRAVLEDTGLVQNRCFVQQLGLLQRRQDSLCRDLDSLLQTAAQQAADHQSLLDVTTRLETEIQDYRRLLDGLRSRGVSSLHPNSAVNVIPFCVTTSPSAFRRNITVNKTINVLGGNLRTMEAQTVSRDHIHTVRQTPVVAPVSGTVTTVQPTTVHSNHPKNSLLTLINTSDLTDSFHKSENQRTGTLPERTEIESRPITTTVKKQSSPVEDKVHTEDLQNSSTVTTQISKGLDKGAVVKASKLETKTGRTIMSVPDTQSVKSATVQAKPETFTSEQTTKDSGLQASKRETHIQAVISKTILHAEPEVQQGPHVITHTTTSEPRKPTSAEVKTETVISAQMNCSEGSIQAEKQDPAEVVSLKLETPTEGVGDAGEVAVTASSVSGSHILRSEEAQGKISGYLALMDDKNLDRQDKKDEREVKDTSHVLNSSSAEQNKAVLDADAGSGITTVSSNNLESKTAQGIITLAPDTQPAKSAAVQEKTEISTYRQSITDSGLQPDKTETIIQTVITTQDDQLESKTASTEILKNVELDVNQGKVADGFHDTNQVKVESDNETKKSICLTDSGVAVKAEAVMSMTDQLLAEKEKQLNSGGQDKDKGSVADNKEVQKPDCSPGGKYGSEEQKETSSMDREVMGQKKSDCQVPKMPGDSKRVLNECVKSASFDNVPANEGTTFSVVASNSEGMATSNSGVASEMAARFGGTAVNSSSTVNGNAEAASIAGTKGRIRHDSRELIVYGGSPEAKKPHQGPNTGSKETPSLPTTSKKETGRFSSGGSGEWIVYGGGIGRKSSLDGRTSLPSEGKEEGHSAATNSARESGSRGGGLEQQSSLSRRRSEESPPETTPSSPSPQEIRRFGSRGSGEWRVYGGSTGRISNCAHSSSLPNVEKEEEAKQITSPPGSLGTGRFSSAGSGEWRVYGGSSGRLSSASSADRVSVSADHNKLMSPTSSHMSSGSRLGSAGSGDRLSLSKVVKRSSSVGSGGQLSSAGSGGRLSNSSGSLRISGEWKPVYSSANARKSSMGSAGRLSGGGTISSQIISSPGGRMIVNIGSSGWLNSPAAGGNSPGSGSKISTAGGTERISTRAGGRISNSSGSGRTNSTGGRVISSSDRPIRSTGSGAGGTKERISVCKMAALSISAAGRERIQDKKEKAQPTRQKQQTGGTSPLLQRWLTTGIKLKSANPDGAERHHESLIG